jgi:hypothetical protein
MVVIYYVSEVKDNLKNTNLLILHPIQGETLIIDLFSLENHNIYLKNTNNKKKYN